MYINVQNERYIYVQLNQSQYELICGQFIYDLKMLLLLLGINSNFMCTIVIHINGSVNFS